MIPLETIRNPFKSGKARIWRHGETGVRLPRQKPPPSGRRQLYSLAEAQPISDSRERLKPSSATFTTQRSIALCQDTRRHPNSAILFIRFFRVVRQETADFQRSSQSSTK